MRTSQSKRRERETMKDLGWNTTAGQDLAWQEVELSKVRYKTKLSRKLRLSDRSSVALQSTELMTGVDQTLASTAGFGGIKSNNKSRTAGMQRLGAVSGERKKIESQGRHQPLAFSPLELHGSGNQPLFPKEQLSLLRDYYQGSIKQAGPSWARAGNKHLGSCSNVTRSARYVPMDFAQDMDNRYGLQTDRRDKCKAQPDSPDTLARSILTRRRPDRSNVAQSQLTPGLTSCPS